MSTGMMRVMAGEERPAATMKAIVQERYGSVDRLELQEIEKPAIGDDSVLVRARAVSVNPTDWRPISGKPYFMRFMVGLRRPKSRLKGTDVAGVVQTVGKNVTEFRPGDEVFGGRLGAFAEYVCGFERNFVHKPAGMTFEQGAAVAIAGVTALQSIRDQGQLQPGQSVLINGAAGGVGTFGVQIAKALGAHVTGVCSTRNVEMVQSLGADHVIDYTEEDFSRSGQRFDLIIDNVGNRSLRDLRRVLAPEGTLVIVGAKNSRWMLGILGLSLRVKLMSRFVEQRLVGLWIAKILKADLMALRDMFEAGKVRPVIDRTYPFTEIREALRYLETGHARAKVVITM